MYLRGKALLQLLDKPPAGEAITEYDRALAKTYLRMLDAEAVGASWVDVAQRLLGVDATTDPAGARERYESHMARAKWLRDGGYAGLLRT